MKKILGYGYKTSSETLSEALSYLTIQGINRTLSETKQELKMYVKSGNVSKRAKLKLFKITIEELK